MWPDSTRFIKSSVTATERLKFEKLPSEALQTMNSSMSGWSTRRMPMFAPRRRPPCLIASVLWSNTLMKETGPLATPPVDFTTSPAGRRWEKEKPVPPPLW